MTLLEMKGCVLHLLLPRRLQLASSCRTNGRTFEVAPTTGSTVFDIRAGIVADQAALKVVPAYITSVCH